MSLTKDSSKIQERSKCECRMKECHNCKESIKESPDRFNFIERYSEIQFAKRNSENLIDKKKSKTINFFCFKQNTPKPTSFRFETQNIIFSGMSSQKTPSSKVTEKTM